MRYDEFIAQKVNFDESFGFDIDPTTGLATVIEGTGAEA